MSALLKAFPLWLFNAIAGFVLYQSYRLFVRHDTDAAFLMLLAAFLMSVAVPLVLFNRIKRHPAAIYLNIMGAFFLVAFCWAIGDTHPFYGNEMAFATGTTSGCLALWLAIRYVCHRKMPSAPFNVQPLGAARLAIWLLPVPILAGAAAIAYVAVMGHQTIAAIQTLAQQQKSALGSHVNQGVDKIIQPFEKALQTALAESTGELLGSDDAEAWKRTYAPLIDNKMCDGFCGVALVRSEFKITPNGHYYFWHPKPVFARQRTFLVDTGVLGKPFDSLRAPLNAPLIALAEQIQPNTWQLVQLFDRSYAVYSLVVEDPRDGTKWTGFFLLPDLFIFQRTQLAENVYVSLYSEAGLTKLKAKDSVEVMETPAGQIVRTGIHQPHLSSAALIISVQLQSFGGQGIFALLSAPELSRYNDYHLNKHTVLALIASLAFLLEIILLQIMLSKRRLAIE